MDKDGLDIWHPFDARAVAEELALPRLADRERPVGILIGNTRALWAPLLAARAADPELASHRNPIQRYTESVIDREASALGAIAYYSHHRYDGAYLPFQRIASAAGLAWLAPTHLLVHPTYGTWFALRAVLLAPGTPPPVAPPVAPPCVCDAACRDAYDAAVRAIGDPSDWTPWLALRDACPVGRQHRYGDNQIRYHYTKDKSALR
jgi:methylmalonic aciduria homocystinuria type C protein